MDSTTTLVPLSPETAEGKDEADVDEESAVQPHMEHEVGNADIQSESGG
jgi:hypothetical protein